MVNDINPILDKSHLAKTLTDVRENEPLVQCITNFVTVNDCANIILAAGGSPSMAHDIREADEAVAAASALVCNIGAIEDTEAMIKAGKAANTLNIPVILDPVAVGGTTLRREAAKKLLDKVRFTAIRGNASEIRYLAGQETLGSGVDVSTADKVDERNIKDVIKMVEALAEKLETIIVLSGKDDIISDGENTAVIKNGCAAMSRITGSGCMATSVIGAFCGGVFSVIKKENQVEQAAYYKNKYFTAAAGAMITMGIAGEMAEEKRLEKKTGNATFRTDLIDAVFNMTEGDIIKYAKYE